MRDLIQHACRLHHARYTIVKFTSWLCKLVLKIDQKDCSPAGVCNGASFARFILECNHDDGLGTFEPEGLKDGIKNVELNQYKERALYRRRKNNQRMRSAVSNDVVS
jgi:ferredoxin